MRWGIEFEYLFVDSTGPIAGRVRDHTNLSYEQIHPLLDDKPGRGDPSLATGDLGIRSGYWYLEGDERFHADGTFARMVVKGVEVRTPPRPTVTAAVAELLAIESQLAARLDRHGLGLAIVGFNPICPAYAFDPPLNPFEIAQRREDASFDGAHVSTLSYGPDINLSCSGWSVAQSLDAARKLNWYGPSLVPFSFSSPFAAGGLWFGHSKRTFERAACRPAVKLFLAEADLERTAPRSRLVHPARLPGEAGRIEFKAFDAMPGVDQLTACCHLLEGVCLAADLPGRSETPDLAAYRRAALAGFEDPQVRAGAAEVLDKARAAQARAGNAAALAALTTLDRLLDADRTPVHDLLAAYRQTGRMCHPVRPDRGQASPLANERKGTGPGGAHSSALFPSEQRSPDGTPANARRPKRSQGPPLFMLATAAGS